MRIAKSLLALENNELEILQSRFKKNASDSLTVEEFVEVVLQLIPPHVIEEELGGKNLLILSLNRFFEQTDDDNSGTLCWDEFCSAVIAAGLAASKAEHDTARSGVNP